MFKFNIPMTVVLSSGSLMLLALGSLLLASNTAHTSDIQTAQARSIDQQSFADSSTLAPTIDEISTAKPTNVSSDARRRSGRLYNQSGYGSQQQSSLDNYASFAVVPQDQSSNLLQGNAQANDASSFASFNDQPPNAGTSSSARQLSTPDAYSSHSNYYAGYSPSTSSASSYNNQQTSANNYHSPLQMQQYLNQHYNKAATSLPLGYPTNNYERPHSPTSSYYDRSYLSAASAPLWSSSGPSSGGLMSSASNALSHWTGGFGISEIICGIIAIAIGAIILGAPFFLIYLALMGNFSGSGTLSLTNPTGGATPAGGSSTTVNGRRKRLAIFEQLSSSLRNTKGNSELGLIAESIMKHIGPLVNAQQVTASFKQLAGAIEKFSTLKPEEAKKKSR